MKLNEFIDEKAKRLTAFERYWHKQARENSTQFPFELGEENWEEKLIAFKELENETNT